LESKRDKNTTLDDSEDVRLPQQRRRTLIADEIMAHGEDVPVFS
jgi:hypothetical protein